MEADNSLSAPTALQLSGTTLTWQHPSAGRFSVYAFPKGMKHSTALSSSEYLLGMAYSKTFSLAGVSDLQNKTIAVVSMDRYGNEYEAAYLNDADELPVYTLTVTSEDETKGTVSGGGEYMQGTEVTLTANPRYGYIFTRWQDGNTQNPRTITVTQNAAYTASFTLQSATPVEEGTLSRELLWQQTVAQSGYLKTGVQNRSIAYYDGKLYVSNGADYEYYIIDAATGILQKTVKLPEQYLAWHNLRITSDGVLLLGNSATSAHSQSVYTAPLGSAATSTLKSYTNSDFGRTDYFYPAGNFSESGFLLFLSNVNSKFLYVPYENGILGSSEVIAHKDLPTGTSAKAIPADASSFFASVAGKPVSRHSLLTGSLLDSWTGAVKPASVNVSGVCSFSLGGHTYILTPADTYGSFETFDITNGMAAAARLFDATPALGSTANSTYTVDFAVNTVGNTAYVWLLAPSNGIAAYKYTFTSTSTGVETADAQPSKVFTTADGVRAEFSGTRQIRLWSVTGQLITSAIAHETYETALPRGAYILTIDGEPYKLIK